MTASRARRLSLLTTGTAILLLGALGGVSSAAERQATVAVTFDFTASSFGGNSANRIGSSPGAPLRSISGTFTVTYPAGNPAGARVTASAMRGGQQGVRASTWARAHAARNMRVALGRPDAPPGQVRGPVLRLDGTACGPRVCGGTNDVSVTFDFDPARPNVGRPTFRSASYAVVGLREIYRARAGTVTRRS